MPRRNVHIALLRGINVGKAKRIAMADLRKLVEKLGYGDVKTILNSGNIIYAPERGTAEQSAMKIEKALLSATGITSRITGITAEELDEIMRANPFPAAVETPSRFLIAVARDAEALRKVEPLAKLNWGSERLVLGKRAAYMWSPDGILEGKMMDAVGKAAGDGITARNWATCGKIAATAKEIAG